MAKHFNGKYNNIYMNKYNIEERKDYYKKNWEFYKESERPFTEMLAKEFNKIASDINKIKEDNSIEGRIELIDVEKALNEYADKCVGLYIYDPADAKEEVDGIDIHTYLESIRYDDAESAYILAIKDGEIKDSILIKGNYKLKVRLNTPEAKQFAIKYSDCKLFTVHNHPRAIAAVANKHDYNAPIDLQEDWSKEFPVPEIIDWGIVTQCDYYSFKQIGKERNYDESK